MEFLNTIKGAVGSISGLLVKTGTGGELTALPAGTTDQYLRGDGTWQAVSATPSHIVTQYARSTAASTTNTIAIPLSGFLPADDMLNVYINSTFILGAGNDYNISGSNIIKTSGTWESGSIFDFVVYKSVLGNPTDLLYISKLQDVSLSTLANGNSLVYNTTLGKWENKTLTYTSVGAEQANANIQSHISSTSNPHSVTAAQVGLGNVTNESKATMFTTPTFTGTPTAPTATAGTNTTQIATTAFVNSEISTAGAAGEVAFFARNTAPTGWLKANGATISRTTYAALFSAIGTTFGVGDGSTTFNIPDMRGYFPRAWDDGRGVDSGRPFGTTQEDDNKSHTHNLYTSRVNSGNVSIYNGCGDGTNVNTSTGWMYASGGVEARPKNISLLACIKY